MISKTKNKPVIVIAGPTASGKSAAALTLCQTLGGEIVSADSMQIYRGMDIGTAKATLSEQKAVRHHLIDILNPGESFSVAAYAQLATKTIADILARDRVAVVCGGTGQYLSALLLGLEFTTVAVDYKLRQELYEQAEDQGLDSLWQKLQKVDPKAAAKIHRTDRKRIVRALEIFAQTGKTKSEHDRKSRQTGPAFDYLSFCLSHQRNNLYERIEARVDTMIERGLATEVQSLIDSGISRQNTCMQAIGYKEMLGYLDGREDLAQAAQAIKQATRRYAKRQLTWFRRMDTLTWLQDLPAREAADLMAASFREKQSDQRG